MVILSRLFCGYGGLEPDVFWVGSWCLAWDV